MGAVFRGPIFATPATADLMRIVLEDSLRVMELDYKKFGVPPFYNEEDLKQTLRQIERVKYGTKIKSKNGINFVLHDAGHILGSASVEINADGPSTSPPRSDSGASLGTGKTILFSGDLGNSDAPIIRDTELPPKCDTVVMESTYAMREHEPAANRLEKLEQSLLDIVQNHGVLLIPAFAIERTQEILWQMHKLADEHKIPESINFFLDSPMAIKVTDEFRHHPEDYDKEALKAYNMHHDFLNFPRLTLARTVEESKAINEAPAPKVIIAGSGMMDGGRILHHLQRYLPFSNTKVLVVGYQAPHSLGRRIIEGEKFVRINGQYVHVHAQIVKADSYSAHADYKKLIGWLTSIKNPPQKIFLNHGEYKFAKDFAEYLRIKYGLDVEVAKYRRTYVI